MVFQAGLNIVTMTAATRHFQCVFVRFFVKEKSFFNQYQHTHVANINTHM